MKYTIITISGIHTGIGLSTDIEGYTEGILETVLPSDEELEEWGENAIKNWTQNNNARMEAICEFLNELER